MQKIFLLPSLDLDLNEDFIVSNTNREAYDAISNLTTLWGVLPFQNTLLILGNRSSGKSYLANIWAELHNAKFLDPRKNFEITLIKKYDNFIIDNMTNFLDEEKLLHYFNIIHEHNKKLLILSTLNYKINLPDLSSRINSLRQIKIRPPDDSIIKLLIIKKFSYYSVIVQQEVINFLVKILPREYDKIIFLIEKLNSLSLKLKRRITIPFIKEISKY